MLKAKRKHKRPNKTKKFVSIKLEHVIEHLHTLLGEVQKTQVTQRAILRKLGVIMVTNAEFAQQLRDLKTQNDKARTEVLAKIAALEEAVNNAGNVTEEVTTAFNELKESVQADDDVVPDGEPDEGNGG